MKIWFYAHCQAVQAGGRGRRGSWGRRSRGVLGSARPTLLEKPVSAFSVDPRPSRMIRGQAVPKGTPLPSETQTVPKGRVRKKPFPVAAVAEPRRKAQKIASHLVDSRGMGGALAS